MFASCNKIRYSLRKKNKSNSVICDYQFFKTPARNIILTFHSLYFIIFIQLADKFVIVIGQQKFDLDRRQRIAQSDVIRFRELHVVILLGRMIRRIALEQRLRAVINLDQVFKVLMLDHHRRGHKPLLNVGQILDCVG